MPTAISGPWSTEWPRPSNQASAASSTTDSAKRFTDYASIIEGFPGRDSLSFSPIRSRQLTERGCQTVVSGALNGFGLRPVLVGEFSFWLPRRVHEVPTTRVEQLGLESSAHVPSVFRVESSCRRAMDPQPVRIRRRVYKHMAHHRHCDL